MGLVPFSKTGQRAGLLSASSIMPARKQQSVSQEESPHYLPNHAVSDFPVLEMCEINGCVSHPVYGCYSSLNRRWPEGVSVFLSLGFEVLGNSITRSLCLSTYTAMMKTLILKKEGLTSNVGRTMPRQALGHESRNQHLSACNHLRSKLRSPTLLSRTLASWTYCFHLCRDYTTLFLVTSHFTTLTEGYLPKA